MLDRLLSTFIELNSETAISSSKFRSRRTQALRGNNATEASEQIKGLLDLVSSTQVHADHDNEEEAIGFLVCGHRSVVGPEISVGDDVVT